MFAKTETIKGQLVDEECFRKEKKVEADSSCATACAKDGKPVAVLTADGKLYQVRGPLAENKNAKLVPHINHTVQITGEVTDFAEFAHPPLLFMGGKYFSGSSLKPL